MTSFRWVDFGRLLIYFILDLSLKDNGKKNYVAIFLRSNAVLTRLLHSVLVTYYDIYGVSKLNMEFTDPVYFVLGH